MKILHLVQKPQRRGAEIFAYELSQQFKEDGHEVSIAYLYQSGTGSSLPIGAEDRMVGASPTHFSEKTIGWNPRVLGGLSRWVQRFQPDVIQSNGARTVKYGALLRMIRPLDPWILIYRSIGDPKAWLKGWTKKSFYRALIIPRFDGIVAVSTTTLEGLKAFYKKLPASVTIPRAIRPGNLIASRKKEDVRSELKTPELATVLIFVGSLSAEKRIDRNLMAISELRRAFPELYLWIVGDGPERRKLEQLSASLAVEDRVRFAGTTDHVADFLNASDLFVLLSETEGIPGVVLEAALSGVPSIASRVGGVPECIVDGETGILVDANNPSQVYSAIQRMISNFDLMRNMGQRAKSYVLERFVMQRISRRYTDFYQGILATRQMKRTKTVATV